MLPNKPGEDAEIVVPSAMQIGWVLSPPFLCTASETVRDVAATYAMEPVGAMPKHPLEQLTMPPEEDGLFWLPEGTSVNGNGSGSFLHLLEVYVDDFIQLAQTRDEDTLRHLSRSLLHAIHSVFPPPAVTGHSGAGPVSIKKLLQGEGAWQVSKEILGWMFDGGTRCIVLNFLGVHTTKEYRSPESQVSIS